MEWCTHLRAYGWGGDEKQRESDTCVWEKASPPGPSQATSSTDGAGLQPCPLPAFLTNPELSWAATSLCPVSMNSSRTEAFQVTASLGEPCGMQSTFCFHLQNQQLRVRDPSCHKALRPPLPAPWLLTSRSHSPTSALSYDCGCPWGRCNLIFSLFLQGARFSGAHFWESRNALGLTPACLVLPWSAALCL